MRRRAAVAPGSGLLGRGFVVLVLSVVVLVPLAALAAKGFSDGPAAVWRAATAPQALDALKLTLLVSLGVAAVNAVMGTVVAWVLVRDSFRGQGVVNALIDLPFALPTIVAGLTLLALYGPNGPAGVNVAYTRWAIVLALLFVTLPFVVRAVQPLLLALDREVEDAAASLGAGRLTVFRRIVLPNLMPGILAGVALSFARAIGEFGSVVLISGNLPHRTEVASVYVFGRIEAGDVRGAAAVSVVLLAIALLVLLAIGALGRRGERRGR